MKTSNRLSCANNMRCFSLLTQQQCFFCNTESAITDFTITETMISLWSVTKYISVFIHCPRKEAMGSSVRLRFMRKASISSSVGSRTSFRLPYGRFLSSSCIISATCFSLCSSALNACTERHRFVFVEHRNIWRWRYEFVWQEQPTHLLQLFYLFGFIILITAVRISMFLALSLLFLVFHFFLVHLWIKSILV